MEGFIADRDTYLLQLEFRIHAARNPKLSTQLGQRKLRLEAYVDLGDSRIRIETGNGDVGRDGRPA
jgi:hypothetical protein